MVGWVRRIVPAGMLIALLVVAGVPQAAADDGITVAACRLQSNVEQDYGSIPLVPVTVNSNHGNPALIATVIDPTTPRQVINVIAEMQCPNLVQALLDCVDNNGQDPAGFLECTDVQVGS